MACREIAALRLSLATIIGIDDEGEKQHDLAELGQFAEKEGPLRSLSLAEDLAKAKSLYENCVGALEEKVSGLTSGDKDLAYYRTLMVLTKKVELDLEHQITSLKALYQDLDEMHDFVHEIYPAGS